MPELLEPVLNEIYNHLLNGATQRRSPMHTPVVGTADGDLRVMVLREFHQAALTLRFHTDARSPKISAITNDPAMTILFYDPDTKVQIRVRGNGRINQVGDTAQAAWAHSTPFARRCYLAHSPPGQRLAQAGSGLPDWAEGITPTPDQAETGRKNFAVVLVEIRSFDWLHLANTGHRRARFDFADGTADGTWLVP